jgi:beta-mannosidase
VWQSMTPGTDLLSASLHGRVARWHDKTGKGYETFVKFVELHYPKSESLEQWSYYSQLNQRDALRFGIEHYRRSEFCRGTLIWQLNDCWPVQSWSVIDSAFCYKAAAFELRRLYAPLLLSLERRGESVRVWGVLDNATCSVGATYGLEVRSLVDGQLLERRESTLQLVPGERRVLESMDVSGYCPTEVIIVAELEGYTTSLLLCEPKQLNLQPSEILLCQTSRGIVVESKQPVIDLWLGDEGNGCQFIDNFVTLAAAGRRLLRARGSPEKLHARSLAGVHPLNLEKYNRGYAS